MRRPPPLVATAVDFVEIMADRLNMSEDPLTELEQKAYDSALKIANLYFLGEIIDDKKPAPEASE